MAAQPIADLTDPAIVEMVSAMSNDATFGPSWIEDDTPAVSVRQERLDTATVTIYTPRERTQGALLWLHGGGLFGGAPKWDAPRCHRIATATGAVVVSVGYRLAPQNPFPAALDDARCVWTWMLSHAVDLGISEQAIAVGGQSAGGGLAAALVQRLVDEGESVAAQWLWVPMLDDRTAENTELDDIDHFVWNNRFNRMAWSSYLGTGGSITSITDYAVPARRTDLSGLPPAFIMTTDIDLFSAEDMDYARRLEAAGVEVTLDIISGAPHGFDDFASNAEPVRALEARAAIWLIDRLSSSSS
ncbi:alpha/beta hydrolase fold domain-containing protein (plasmid) [Arthrobacter sp. G.S.26]|uniref:alpha/beta hydrolase n=1 Tax=Arthrobacter sp. G.S.26 TaxID=3433706 RepID=UPI003D777C27